MTADQQTERYNTWLNRYSLVRAHYSSPGACLRPLLGKRCLVYYPKGRRAGCPSCLGNGLADHGYYYRTLGTELRLFVGQPYHAPRDGDLSMLDEARSLGLYVHIGRQGDGWWNSDVYPVVISNQPIPKHGYRY